MNQVYFNRRKYEVPGSWDELSYQQLVRIAGILFNNRSVAEKRIQVLLVLLQVRWRWWLSWVMTFKLSQEGRYDLLLLTDFVFEEEIQLQKAIIDPIRIQSGWKKIHLCSPKDGIIGSITFMQFIYAEQAFMKFANSKMEDEQSLDRLVGILYCKEKFDSDRVAVYQLYGSRVSLDVKLAVYLWYQSCRLSWGKLFPEVFKKSKEGDSAGPPGGIRRTSETGMTDRDNSVSVAGWVAALRNLAGGALHMEQMADVKADIALYDLNEKIREAEEMESKLRSRK